MKEGLYSPLDLNTNRLGMERILGEPNPFKKEIFKGLSGFF